MATAVAREGDLDEIGRVVAEEATLLLGATGSAVYRFESQGDGHLRRRPPAGRVTARWFPHHVHRRHHRDRPHGEDRRARPRLTTRRRCRATPPCSQVLEAGLRSGIARRSRRAAASGAPSRPAPRAARVRPRRESAASPPSQSSRPSPSPTPRPASSWRAWRNRPPHRARQPARHSRSGSTGEVERARRHGHLLTLVILDLDDFKAHQRHLRPPGGRPGAGRGGPPPGHAPAAPASWSRGSAARSSPWILPQVDASGAMAPVERARASHAKHRRGRRLGTSPARPASAT